MTAIRMAVVGTGALGRHHARILAQMPGVELVAVADTNLAAAAETAARCQTTPTADYRALLGQVAAVVVAVPTSVHAAVARDFLTAGADVFVEKPIAGSVHEAREIVSLADRHKAVLQVGHVERFNPALAAARPFLGRARYIRAERFAPFSFRSTDIGVVHDLMIHDLDVVLDLVAVPVIDLQAFGTAIVSDLEDCVQARITFSDGTIADLAANRVSPVASRQMQIWGADGCVHIDFAARTVVRYAPGPALRFGGTLSERARQKGADIEKLKSEVFGSFIEVHRPAIVPCDQLTEELVAFTESVRTRTQPLVDGEIALKAMVVAERVLDRIAHPSWSAPETHDLAARRLAG
jgi:predicted dehydrogenase